MNTLLINRLISKSKLAGLLLLAVLIPSATGCVGLAAHIGYFIWGNKVPAEYPGLEDKRVAVICTAGGVNYGPDTATDLNRGIHGVNDVRDDISVVTTALFHAIQVNNLNVLSPGSSKLLGHLDRVRVVNCGVFKLSTGETDTFSVHQLDFGVDHHGRYSWGLGA